MDLNLNDIIERSREVLSVQRVFGEPIHENGVTVVPAAPVRGGGGGGGGSGTLQDQDQTGGGAGFGVLARPVGAYVIRGNDVEWRPAIDVTRLAMSGAVVAGLGILTVRTAIKKSRRRR
jgi:uncharacterized spore protein YtfJ